MYETDLIVNVVEGWNPVSLLFPALALHFAHAG